MVDGDHFFRAYVDGAGEVGIHEAADGFDAFIDIEERAGLAAIAPDFDLAAIGGLGDLAAEGGGCLFAASVPSAFGSEDIVEARDANLDAVVAAVGKVETLAEEFFPTAVMQVLGYRP